MTHQCGSCTDAGCTGLCREALPDRLRARTREFWDGRPAADDMAVEMDAAAAELDRLRRVLGDVWAVLRRSDVLTRDELAEELENALAGLPAAAERRALNERDRMAHALREIGAMSGNPAGSGPAVGDLARVVRIARAALAEVER